MILRKEILYHAVQRPSSGSGWVDIRGSGPLISAVTANVMAFTTAHPLEKLH